MNRPYLEIIESDISDADKMQMICEILDRLKAVSPEMSFLVDMVIQTREELAEHAENAGKHSLFGF